MGCRAHLCHLPGHGQVNHSPKGNHWECWESGKEPNVVGTPVLLPPTIWPTQIMTGWYLSHNWLAGQLQLASWLTSWLPIEQNVNLIFPIGRDILWPSVWLLWSHMPVVRCGPKDEASASVKQHLKCKVCSNFQMSFLNLVRCNPPLEASHGQVWYYFRQVDLWPDVPHRDILCPSVVLS